MTYTIQMRNGSRVFSAFTLDGAIALGLRESGIFGAFDISAPSGAILWVWEQRYA